LFVFSLWLSSGQVFVDAEDRNFADELPRTPSRSPEAGLKSIETVADYRVDLIAAEPLVTDPVAMSFDADGRLYVVEMRDYSEQDQERLGRVRLLEDVDDDGVFDKATVFADELSWPTAIIAFDGGVFVGAPPLMLWLKDTNGDLRADERRVVYEGFSRSNVQGLMHSLRWGLDNRIHGATGTAGGRIVRPDVEGMETVDLRGRDFSFDPRSLDIRAETGGAQHGMCFDDWGRKFCCSNSDHLQFVMYDQRYAARFPEVNAPRSRRSIAADGPQAAVFRRSPIEPWRIVRTRLRVAGDVPGPVEGGGKPAGYFTGATGATIYRGDAMPSELGRAFIGDVGSNLVHRKEISFENLEPVGRRIDQASEFLTSDDIWFRPVQFANAPDGGLHVLDMSRETIEHPKSLPEMIKKHLDLTSGRDQGRLYRVVPQNYVH
jgi:putative membrane-bound dehydrogenase-like protein